METKAVEDLGAREGDVPVGYNSLVMNPPTQRRMNPATVLIHVLTPAGQQDVDVITHPLPLGPLTHMTWAGPRGVRMRVAIVGDVGQRSSRVIGVDKPHLMTYR